MGLRPLVTYLAAATTLVVAYFVVPGRDLRFATWLVLMWATVAALVVGIRLHRPAATAPWRTVVLGLSLMALADTVDAAWWGAGTQELRSAVADIGALAGYVLLGVAALRFGRAQSGGRDRGPVLDSVIVTVALTTVLWEAMLSRHGVADGVTSTLVSVLIVSLVASWVAAMTLRVVLAGGYRVFSGWALLTASWSVFCAVAVFLWSYVDIRLRLEGPIDLLWLVPVTAIGLSVLHPRMTALTERHDELESADTVTRTVLPALALLLPPGAVLVRWGAEGVIAPFAASASVLVACVVIMRFAGLVVAQMQARSEVVRRADRDRGLASLGERGLSGAPTAEVLRLAEELLTAEIGPLTLHLAAAGAPDAGSSLPGSRGLVEVGGFAGEPISEDAQPFVQAVGQVLAAVIAQRRSEELLRHRALHDSLTGLANRTLLEERLEAVLDRPREPGRCLAVLFADLVGFKAVNDRFGHAAGDEVLVAVAQRLRALVGPDDVLARFAGDEFVLVVHDIAEAELPRLCDAILTAVAEPIDLAAGIVTVTSSLGVTPVVAGDQRDADRLVCDADAAMFAAKQRGSHRAEVFDSSMRMGSLGATTS